jgi:putative transposase
MEKFKNKYRISSSRAQWWDYKRSAAYFITVCTRYRDHFFGQIINDEMHLSEIGKIVESEWLNTPQTRPDMNLILGPFVIMPDHFHAIIEIGDNAFNRKHCRDAMHRVSTITSANNACFAPQSKNLSSIMRGFKSTVTVQSRILNPSFAWQPRYHDRIIRDQKSYDDLAIYSR